MPRIRLKRFRQKTDETCGPACTQMILYSIKRGVYDQEDLYDQIKRVRCRDRIKWSSSPPGVTRVLNKNKKPGRKKGKFRTFRYLSAETLTHKMTTLISELKIPCVALTLGGDHWIVVNGYRTRSEVQTGRPSGMPDKITDIWITNSAGAFDFDLPVQGNVDIHTWLKTDFIPVNIRNSIYKGKCLAICDPPARKRDKEVQSESKSDPAKNFMFFNMSRKYQPSLQKPEQKAKQEKPERSKDKIIKSKEAAKITSFIMKDRRFDKVDFLKKTLSNYKIGQPVLVKQINKRKDFYYITPLNNNKSDVCALISFGAYKGEYRRSAFLTNDKKGIIFQPLNKLELFELLKQTFKDDEISSKLPSSPKGLIVYPVLTWKPCQESLSPFLPFYMINLGKRKIYVRVDKKVFTKLTSKMIGA